MAKETGTSSNPADMLVEKGGSTGTKTTPATERPRTWKQRIRAASESEILAVQSTFPEVGSAPWPAPWAAALVLETFEPEDAVKKAVAVFSAHVASMRGGNTAEQIYASITRYHDRGVSVAWAYIRGTSGDDITLAGPIRQQAGVEFVAQLGVALLAAGLTPEQVAKDILSRTASV